MQTRELQLIESEAAAALLHPLRRKVLETLREPDSASGLARRLELPRQKLNYHLRELERLGLLELVEERRRGNCNERVLQATARSYVIDPATLGELAASPEEVRDRFSVTYLMALAARAVEDLGALTRRAASAGKRLATLSLQVDVRFRDAEARKAFSEELTREIARLTTKYHAPEGRTFRFIVGGYPTADPDKEE